ncbi:MAG: DUF445 domain-containing protein [Selenomonadaceae bacterium]|nr:DUF445 domain-containing protein [Selenomonadaceae bacterium]
MQKKFKATLALTASALGLVGTIPYAQAGFGWGLLNHGFIAATIGGLADWFAVTALFRKPLGIAYRTEILRRNRERIMESIVDFAGNDLLSVQNIMGVVEKQDTAELMLDYLQHRGGEDRLINVAREVVLGFAASIDTRKLTATIAPALREGIATLRLDRLMADSLVILAEEKHSRRILGALLTVITAAHNSPGLQQMLLESIRLMRQKYEGDSAGRAFVLASMGLTDEKILEILNEKISHKLTQMQDENSADYAEIMTAVQDFLRSLHSDAELRGALQTFQDEFTARLDFSDWLANWLEENLKGKNPFWLLSLDRFIHQKIAEFAEKKSWQNRFDRLVKNFVAAELTKHHEVVEKLIRARLSEFSDDELTEFVEAKVADDLQMIRINGSLVGALVGMGLYVIVWLTERMWGG